MSAIARLRNRSGKSSKRHDSYANGNHSYNARIHHYTNGIPKPMGRPPKKLKTKRKYANVQSKYSSVFSKYLHEPAYPPSVKSKKLQRGPSKNGQQDRLMKRIFGNENNFKHIKSLMNNSQANYAPQQQKNKPLKDNERYGNKRNTHHNNHSPKAKYSNGDKPYEDVFLIPEQQMPAKAESEKVVNKDKDLDVKLEKALLDLSEHKNNFYKDKSEFDKQIEQTKKDKDARLRQTFYGNGPYPGSHNVLNGSGIPDPSTINSSNYYQPIGYNTGGGFRPSTQENSHKRMSFHGEGLADGDILSNIDNISNDELKERLIVSEIIMKKLYTRNKDLETAIGKAQTKIKEVKRNTTQNFFKSNMKADPNDTNGFGDIDKSAEPEEQDNGSGSESDIEIGCKECDKYRENEVKLNKELDKKTKKIFELEEKVKIIYLIAIIIAYE